MQLNVSNKGNYYFLTFVLKEQVFFFFFFPISPPCVHFRGHRFSPWSEKLHMPHVVAKKKKRLHLEFDFRKFVTNLEKFEHLII